MLGYYPDRVYLNGEGRVNTPDISLYFPQYHYLGLKSIRNYLDQRFIL